MALDPTVIVSEDRLQSQALWMAAIVWNLICIYFWRNFFKHRAEAGWTSVMDLFFPMIGIAILIGAIWCTLAVRKYGEPTLRLKEEPVSLGKTFEGVVDIPKGIHEDIPMRWSLVCTRKEQSTNRRVYDYELWKSSGEVSAGDWSRYPDGRATLAVHIPLPTTIQDFDFQRDSAWIRWQLTLKAIPSNVFFETHFFLPDVRASNEP